tara:strand:- start:1509 stop:2288 length:780 start_codon:yes stop_codon:yes gene_type:complete
MSENDKIQSEDSGNAELSNTSLVLEIPPLENKEDTSGKEVINQDFNQMINVSLTLCLEIYRVLMGALLVFVVPQKCNDEACTLQERFGFKDAYSQTTIVFNFITFATFLMLYFVEVKRENKLIKYLEVNRFKPRDNESVGKALNFLDEKRKKTLLSLDKMYMNSGYIAIAMYILNTGLSVGFVAQRILNSTSYTVLLTNVLFMSSKLANVYEVAHTKPNVFLSSYLTRKLQYNDVDPDKKIEDQLLVNQTVSEKIDTTI